MIEDTQGVPKMPLFSFSNQTVTFAYQIIVQSRDAQSPFKNEATSAVAFAAKVLSSVQVRNLN